ncbi:hypothetical protein Tco_0463226 [Tanacetum coccineum]
MSDMTVCLNDLSYIPMNNEQNKPTQGDIGETSNEFEELYASANEELYPGCDYVTRLDFMAKFTYFNVQAGRMNTRDKTRNLSLKEVAEAKGPVSIQFDVGDKQTLNPLGPHAAHWSNYIGEVIRTVPLYYPSWEKVPKERKAALISNIGTLFDLRPHMESPRWSDIYEGINMHLQKAYNTNKASFKAKHWRVDPQTGTYDVEAIRQTRPEEITADEWDKYIRFWNDPKNLARAAQNRKQQQGVVYLDRRSRSLARLRDEMEDEKVGGLRVSTREDEIKSIGKRGKLRGTFPVVVAEFESGGASGSGGCGDDEESGDDEEGEDEDGDDER